MRRIGSLGASVLISALALASAAFSGGCGGAAQTGQAAAQLSPEMQQKTDQMLQDYGKMYSEKNRAKKGRR